MHPDVADAGRYAIQGYFDSYVAPKVKEDVRTVDARKRNSWGQSIATAC